MLTGFRGLGHFGGRVIVQNHSVQGLLAQGVGFWEFADLGHISFEEFNRLALTLKGLIFQGFSAQRPYYKGLLGYFDAKGRESK